jgi:hypothetical protein
VILYMGGAEQKGWRELLYDNGVRDMSLSFVGLLRRTTKPERFLLRDEFPDDVNIFVDSGTYTLNKADSNYGDVEVAIIASQYYSFIEANVERIKMASSYDAKQLSEEQRMTWNARLKLALGDKYLPIWTPEFDMPRTFPTERMGIQAGRSISQYTAQLNRMVMDSGIKLHGVAMTQIDAMRDVRWDSVGSTSWLSPSQYGDTILWTGTELKRFPKDYKGRGREGHRSWIIDNGFDFDLIASDDSTELLRLSIWSWQRYVERLDLRSRVTQVRDSYDPEKVDRDNSAVAHNSTEGRQRKLLPVLTTKWDEHTEIDDDGNEFIVRTPKIGVSDQSLMQCSTCVIQDRCPEFSAGSECAFDFPLNLSLPRAEDELWTSMTEIQGQRVLLMRMFEQVNGSGYDPNLGPEIDRLMRIMNARKKQSQTTIRQVSEITIPAGQGGVLTELLGAKAANRLHQNEIEQGNENVIDADVVEDSE